MKYPTLALSLALAGLPLQATAGDTADNLYRNHCAGCHGGEPPAAAIERAAQTIRDGLPDKGMPAFGAQLSDGDIRALAELVSAHSRQEAGSAPAPLAAAAIPAQRLNPEPSPGYQLATPETEAISAGGHRFRLVPVASATGELWDMDFLPDGTAIATQKGGQLWLFKDGERQGPVTGTPAVKYEGQGGLLGVTVHPDYAENGWIYLTYTGSGTGKGGAMTTVVRGKLKGLRWVDQEEIYTAPENFYTGTNHHFGSRLVVRDGYLYFSVGDRGHRDGAQDTGDPRGKIHRLYEDGRIPEDNPFVAAGGAAASVWSYGHRNPQGMALQPRSGAIWSAEHGPRGGDEVNLIQRGRNYGWPLVTFGINYDGTVISEHSHREGMESPKHHWTPSIAVSDIDFYTGDHFPTWRNHLLAASLAAQELHLLRIDGDKVVDDQVLLEDAGRIRDVRNGPDGYPYLLIGSDIFRLEPVED